MELRRRMMGKNEESIPYQKIEYLESTGTQYINTGFFRRTGNQYTMVVDCLPTSFENYKTIFTAGADYAGYCVMTLSGDKVCLSSSSYISYANQRKTYTYTQSSDGKTNTLTDGNTTVTHVRTSANYSYQVQLCTSYTSSYNCNAKIYSFQIYEAQNLVMVLIPVRIDTTGYMYDKVSKQLFGNAGTGNFILGPDIN